MAKCALLGGKLEFNLRDLKKKDEQTMHFLTCMRPLDLCKYVYEFNFVTLIYTPHNFYYVRRFLPGI